MQHNADLWLKTLSVTLRKTWLTPLGTKYDERENRECLIKKPNKYGWTTNKKMLDPSIFIFLLKRKQYPEKDIPNGVHY